jgi:hypothetical protein
VSTIVAVLPWVGPRIGGWACVCSTLEGVLPGSHVLHRYYYLLRSVRPLSEEDFSSEFRRAPGELIEFFDPLGALDSTPRQEETAVLLLFPRLRQPGLTDRGDLQTLLDDLDFPQAFSVLMLPK